ncbi:MULTISPECIES: hypothetical protein [unclassified Streptomyces]|uniref:hypothetical protein n=1 Tax=unclassified Streptomyces TaxID=2593676 RepID=UPI002E148713|nr:hypothetical protein OG452_24795 [Streptomyces sp. NBC_01197]WSS49029.1 hypothetical protein OG708_10450 [Streptomyces sp. NBC_01180]
MTTTAISEPPATAVARDAHWSAKMARLKARKLPERSLRMCDDDQAKKNVTDAAMELAKARTAARAQSIEQGVSEADREDWTVAQPDVVAAQLRLEAVELALDEVTVVLTFRALPRPAWEQLLRDHSPTEAQADQGMEYNVETYPAALISACHIERNELDEVVPGMSEQDAQELLDAWPDSEAKALFTCALLVNQTLRADLGKG